MYKKTLAALFAAALALTVCTACGDKTKKNGGSSGDGAVASDASAQADSGIEYGNGSPDGASAEIEEPAAAQSGDAFLMITDEQWYAQFFGNTEKKNEDLLCWGAQTAHITGNGDYTVSVNAGSHGTQKEITGDPNGSYQCSGLGFAAVKVEDGTKLFPNMSIEIREIRVDGNPVTLSAKNYTSSDDNTEMRANIYNDFVSRFPEDAHNAGGQLSGEFGEYSSKIVDPASFAKWQRVEVDFTVSGIGDAE